jgi:hypothetical protein
MDHYSLVFDRSGEQIEEQIPEQFQQIRGFALSQIQYMLGPGEYQLFQIIWRHNRSENSLRRFVSGLNPAKSMINDSAILLSFVTL